LGFLPVDFPSDANMFLQERRKSDVETWLFDVGRPDSMNYSAAPARTRASLRWGGVQIPD
jgi:hypothetical protein